MNPLQIKNEYYAAKAVNQSLLKALLAGIGTYKKAESNLFYEEADHFILGNLVDCYLTTPSLIEQEFFVVPELESKPSDKVMSIVQEVYSKKRTMFLNDHCDEIYTSLNEHEYYLNRKKDTCEEDNRVTDIIEKGVEYWNALIESKNRQIISLEEKELAKNIVESLKTNPRTAKYFNSKNITLYQYPIYFKYSDLNCKALFDMLLINTKQKLIQPVDIKTIGGSTKEFPRNVQLHKYDIQAAWYSLALKLTDYIQTPLHGEIDISDYTILPFRFIVESTKSPGLLPLVYEISEEDMHIARFGAKKLSSIQTKHKVLSRVREIKGFEEAIELYKWHELNDQWELDKKISEQEVQPLILWNR